MLIRARRSGIALALVSVSAAAASAAPSGAGAATRVPVLGKYRLFPSPSVGFGTYKPARIYNGGGMVDSVNDITWSRWGTKLAHGVGHAPELRPSGGYYAREARIKLHAFSLGRCRPRGPLAYRQLWFSEQVRPGATRYTKWRPWLNLKSICSQQYR